MQKGDALQIHFLVLGAWLFLGHADHTHLIFCFSLQFFCLTPERYSSPFSISAVCFGFLSTASTPETFECTCSQKHCSIGCGRNCTYNSCHCTYGVTSESPEKAPDVSHCLRRGPGSWIAMKLGFWASLHLEGTEWVIQMVHAYSFFVNFLYFCLWVKCLLGFVS